MGSEFWVLGFGFWVVGRIENVLDQRPKDSRESGVESQKTLVFRRNYLLLSKKADKDELAKSRHSGRSRIESGRSPDDLQLVEKTGFRLGRHPGLHPGTE